MSNLDADFIKEIKQYGSAKAYIKRNVNISSDKIVDAMMFCIVQNNCYFAYDYFGDKIDDVINELINRGFRIERYEVTFLVCFN